MRIEIYLDENDNFDNLTFASELIEICEKHATLDAVKVAKAILLEIVGE